MAHLRLSVVTTLRAASHPTASDTVDTAACSAGAAESEAQAYAVKGNRALRSAQCYDEGSDLYCEAAGRLWEAPPPGMLVVPLDSKRTLSDAERPVADLAAERFIQAAKCTDPELRNRWNSAAWSTVFAIYARTEEERAVALNRVDAVIAKIPGQR